MQTMYAVVKLNTLVGDESYASFVNAAKVCEMDLDTTYVLAENSEGVYDEHDVDDDIVEESATNTVTVLTCFGDAFGDERFYTVAVELFALGRGEYVLAEKVEEMFFG